jgi:hypothetical protein
MSTQIITYNCGGKDYSGKRSNSIEISPAWLRFSAFESVHHWPPTGRPFTGGVGPSYHKTTTTLGPRIFVYSPCRTQIHINCAAEQTDKRPYNQQSMPPCTGVWVAADSNQDIFACCYTSTYNNAKSTHQSPESGSMSNTFRLWLVTPSRHNCIKLPLKTFALTWQVFSHAIWTKLRIYCQTTR